MKEFSLKFLKKMFLTKLIQETTSKKILKQYVEFNIETCKIATIWHLSSINDNGMSIL